jgi:deoxyribonuclease V
VAADAAFARLTGARVAVVPDVAPYQPGQFYLRELPPLRAVLDGVGGLSLLVIDGYADLDPDGRPGLGARAREEFGVPVIGVAKTPFRTATHAIAVLRGTSARPLYVTAAGMSRADAADLVRHMAGRHRLPDALRRADTLARRGLPEPPLVNKPRPPQHLSRQDGVPAARQPRITFRLCITSGPFDVRFVPVSGTESDTKVACRPFSARKAAGSGCPAPSRWRRSARASSHQFWPFCCPFCHKFRGGK